MFDGDESWERRQRRAYETLWGRGAIVTVGRKVPRGEVEDFADRGFRQKCEGMI